MIDRCICHEVPFKRALAVAREQDCQSLEELQGRIELCNSCQMCRPYLQEMLRTGQTEFSTD